MLPIQFNARIWKQGNSLLITIPKEVRVAYNMKEGNNIRISTIIVDEDELKKEEELAEMKARGYDFGEGSIIHKGDEVARLSRVFYKIRESRGGSYAEFDSIDKLPLIRSVVGIISKGRFISKSFDEKHYGAKFLQDEVLSAYLTGTETIRLNIEKGKTLEIQRLDFEGGIIKKGTPKIEKVKFHGYID